MFSKIVSSVLVLPLLVGCAAATGGGVQPPPEIESSIYMRVAGGGFTADISRDSDGEWTVVMLEPLYGFTVKGADVSFGEVSQNTKVTTPFDGVCAAVDAGKSTGTVLGKSYTITRGNNGTISEVVFDGVTYVLMPVF